ncbi:MAG: hypothetical protein HYY06_15080 [Deltaproteobacteria bacterium]|nr:hypothetical protein [Deltaproteobacteria bacterium]
MRTVIFVVGIVTTACTDERRGAPDASLGVDAAASADGSPDAESTADAAVDAAGDDHPSSLSVCWTDATCERVMLVAHGGAWDLVSAPYDSNAALAAAFDAGADGVKIDVRVTRDDVPVIAHSSPIESFESSDCDGLVIEDSTAAEVTACHRYPSETEAFQRLDDVLATLEGKMVVQLTVKRPQDYARAIEAVLEASAEDFAFFEIDTSELDTLIPEIPGSDSVYYLINIDDLSEVDVLLEIASPRAFMYEMDPTLDVAGLVADRLHPAGIRSFTYDRTASSEEEIRALYDRGFDVVSTQVAVEGVAARMAVNEARGVSPP